MAYTQADLDTIEAAIATGELEVTIDAKHVRYRSIDELKKAREMILAALATTNDTRRVFYFTHAGRRD